MSTITTTTVIDAADLAKGDLIVDPSCTLHGVFEVADTIECTDVDTDRDSVIVVLSQHGSVILDADASVVVVVG